MILIFIQKDRNTLGHSNRNSSGYLPVPFLNHKHFLLASSTFDIGKLYVCRDYVVVVDY